VFFSNLFVFQTKQSRKTRSVLRDCGSIRLFFLFPKHPSCRGDEREHRRRAADKNGGTAVVIRPNVSKLLRFLVRASKTASLLQAALLLRCGTKLFPFPKIGTRKQQQKANKANQT
jgi:hypothetical protein